MGCTPKVRQKTFGVQFVILNYDTASCFKLRRKYQLLKIGSSAMEFQILKFTWIGRAAHT